VPVGAALLLRTRRELAVWLGLFLVACLAQIQLADPERFALPRPHLTLVVSLLVYGALALAYQRTRDWARDRVREAESRARELGALLPICSYCKQVRDDDGYWHQVELYLAEHAHAEVTHGICPTCLEEQRQQLRLLTQR